MPKPPEQLDLAFLTSDSPIAPSTRLLPKIPALAEDSTWGSRGEPESRLRPLPIAEPRPESTGVIDLQAARRRLRTPVVDGRQALVLTLVEQLSGLVRGTTNPERAGAIRRAASHALDVLDRIDAGEADPAEARRAFREVESLLARPC